MDMSEMTPVSTHSTENILPENRLQAKRTRDRRRGALAWRCGTLSADLLKDLRSLVEVFPSM